MKPQRHQSPPYPSLDLPTAIAKAQTFYEKQKRNLISVTITVQTLGYSPTNTEGRRAVSTIIAFGLFDEETINHVRHVRLSPLGLNILRHESNPALRLPLLQEAAMRPSIYGDMINKWPDELPSTLAITQYLEFDKGFNGSAVGKLIRNFRATYEFANLESRPTSPAEGLEAMKEEAAPVPVRTDAEPREEEARQDAAPVKDQTPAVMPPVGRATPSPQCTQETEEFVVPLLGGRRLVDYNGRENLDTETGKNKLDSRHHEKTTFTRFQSQSRPRSP